MDFVLGLPQSADWRGNGYDSILVFVNWLTKLVHYKSVQTTITAPALAEIILNVVVWPQFTRLHPQQPRLSFHIKVMVELADNAENVSTGYTPFELNYNTTHAFPTKKNSNHVDGRLYA